MAKIVVPFYRRVVRMSAYEYIGQRFGLGGRRGVDGILEVYNLFNHANYGSYTLAESNANYGQPIQNIGLTYQPRMVQLGFRVVF